MSSPRCARKGSMSSSSFAPVFARTLATAAVIPIIFSQYPASGSSSSGFVSNTILNGLRELRELQESSLSFHCKTFLHKPSSLSPSSAAQSSISSSRHQGTYSDSDNINEYGILFYDGSATGDCKEWIEGVGSLPSESSHVSQLSRQERHEQHEQHEQHERLLNEQQPHQSQTLRLLELNPDQYPEECQTDGDYYNYDYNNGICLAWLTFYDESFDGMSDGSDAPGGSSLMDGLGVRKKGGKGGGGKGGGGKKNNANNATDDTENSDGNNSANNSKDSPESLAGTPMPRKCQRQIANGRPMSLDCLEWFAANPDAKLPTSSPTSSPTPAPTRSPINPTSSSLTENMASDEMNQVILPPSDDTFIERWRPDEPLGMKEKIKIDAGPTGVPVKIAMLKFDLSDTPSVTMSLTSAKLKMFAITDTVFGGWIQHMEDNEWEEDTAVWDDYVGGKNGGRAVELLPNIASVGGGGSAAAVTASGTDGASKGVMGEFGVISAGQWYEADITQSLRAFLESHSSGGINTGLWLSMRLTTNSTDGVIYASKEHPSENGPKLILEFGLEELGGAQEGVEAVVEDGQDEDVNQNEDQDEDKNENISQGTSLASSSPTISPTRVPTKSPISSNASTQSASPTNVPTKAPTKAIPKTPTKGPTANKSPVTSFEVPNPTSGPVLYEGVPTAPNSPTGPTIAPITPSAHPHSTKASEAPTQSPMINESSKETGEILERPNEGMDSQETLESSSGKSLPTLSPTKSPSQLSTIPQNPDSKDDNASLVLVGEDSGTTAAVITASIVSSSFRMTISAMHSNNVTPNSGSDGNKRNDRNIRSNLRKLSKIRKLNNPFLPLDQKEEPAILQHLTRVYQEKLSYPPIEISLAFENGIDVEMVESSDGGSNGVLRTSVFRVIAIFNNSEIKELSTAEASAILDEITLYAFFGVEEGAFIDVLKSTGDPILAESTGEGGETGEERAVEMDVTVTKVLYSFADEVEGDVKEVPEKVQFSTEANRDSIALGDDGAVSSWVQPALICGAVLLVFATSGAVLILVRQRRDYQDGSSDIDPSKSKHTEHNDPYETSPRSTSDTVAPSTPSPTLFIDRWKKRQFDYAEFEDDPDIEVLSNDSVCAMSPHEPGNAQAKYMAPPGSCPRDIKFSHFLNTSFDDSSVSDVSAHVAQGTGAHEVTKQPSAVPNSDKCETCNDPSSSSHAGSQAESFLLDTTMESYNMEAMSALDQVRFENVLQIDTTSPLVTGKNHPTPSRAMRMEDGSVSTGDVPSELYSNLSIDFDTSAIQNTSNINDAGPYVSNLNSLDMLRKHNDSYFTDMPPPPSEAGSEASSRGEDDSSLVDGTADSSGKDEKMNGESGDLEHDYLSNKMGERTNANQLMYDETNSISSSINQEEVSKCINDELTKVMKLLRSPDNEDEDDGEERRVVEDLKLEANRNNVSFEAGDAESDASINNNDDPYFLMRNAGNVDGDKVEDNIPIVTDLSNANLSPQEENIETETKCDEESLITVSIDGGIESQDRKPAVPSKSQLKPFHHPKPTTNDNPYDGVNVLVDGYDSSESEATDKDPLQMMNATLADCMTILGKARPHRSSTSS